MFFKKFVYCIIFCTCFITLGCNEKDIEKIKNNKVINLSGKLILVGNSQFERLALVFKDNQQIFLTIQTKSEKKKLLSNIGKKVKVKGILSKKQLTTADDKIVIKEYTLIVKEIKFKRL